MILLFSTVPGKDGVSSIDERPITLGWVATAPNQRRVAAEKHLWFRLETSNCSVRKQRELVCRYEVNWKNICKSGFVKVAVTRSYMDSTIFAPARELRTPSHIDSLLQFVNSTKESSVDMEPGLWCKEAPSEPTAWWQLACYSLMGMGTLQTWWQIPCVPSRWHLLM